MEWTIIAIVALVIAGVIVLAINAPRRSHAARDAADDARDGADGGHDNGGGGNGG